MAVQHKNRLLVNQADVLRVAITQGSQLLDLDVETPHITQIKGNIYKGKISSIEPSLAAAFVDFGRERHGFLPFKEISPEYFSKDIDPSDTEGIAKGLKLGQPIIIQVEKEERGNKGAALTTYLSLAGSYLVLMPNNPKGGGISRRIEGEEREQLKATLDQLNIPEKMSVIIRTAGVHKSAKDLQWDLDTLLTYFDALKLAATMDRAAPYLIHQESNVLIRTLRDYMRADIDEVILDDKDCFEQAHAYMKQVRPELLDRVKHYDNPTPLFSRYQIETQIESSFSREVRLPSGGSIIIDQTEALVAIDVNSARATRGKSIEETAFNTNLEAAREVARQLRLRDLGGLIIVDFIDMNQFKHQREVENALKDAVASDRARIQFARISRFGLLEMSRQRLRSGTNKNIRNACPRCEGTGMVRTVESLSRTIIHLLEEKSSNNTGQKFHVRVPVSVATHLSNERRGDLAAVESNGNAKITILPCEELFTPQYEIKVIKGDQTDSQATPSYKLLKNEKQTPKKAAPVIQPTEQPRIEQFLKNKQDEKPAPSGGLFNFIKKLFSSESEEPVKAASKGNKKGGANKSSKSRSKSTNERGNRNNKQNTRTRNGNKQSRTKTPTAKGANQRNSNSSSENKNRSTRKPRGKQNTAVDKQATPTPSSDKPVKTSAAEINDLVMDNDLSIKPKAKNKKSAAAKKAVKKTTATDNSTTTENKQPSAAKIVQADVVQRPMKAGKRISPVNKKAESKTVEEPKKAYAPGRKIQDAPADQQPKAKKPSKPTATYVPGKKVIDANGDKVTDQ